MANVVDQAMVVSTIAGVKYWDEDRILNLEADGTGIVDLWINTTITVMNPMTIQEVCRLKTILEIDNMPLFELCNFHDNQILSSESCTINHAAEERSTAYFAMTSPIQGKTDAKNFTQGQEVILKAVGPLLPQLIVTYYGGVVETCDFTVPSPDLLILSISCTDYQYICDNRIFAEVFVAPYPGGIASEVYSQKLFPEGIIEGDIGQGGAVLQDQVFNYLTVTEVLDKAAELAGYQWFITEEKVFYFVPRTSYEAEWDIASADDIMRDGISLTNMAPEYRNVQYISGGKGKTSARTETFIGDNWQRTFTVGFPIASVPTIYFNGVLLTTDEVGIKGVDSDKKWYWSEDDNTITQEDTDTPITPTDTLEITYVGSYDIMAVAKQSAEITNWKARAGFGTGFMEKVFADTSLTSKDAALDSAKSKLLHYATLGRKLQYNTRDYGLAAGVIQHVTIPMLGLNAVDMLISNMDVTFDNYGPLIHVTAVEGPVDRTWEQIFCDLAADAKRSAQAVGGQESTIQGLETFSKTWLQTEHPNPFIQVFPDILPSDIDFPCMEPSNALRYLVLYKAGSPNPVEFFRKEVVDQLVYPARIYTTGILLATEGNAFPIVQVGLWGGSSATMTAGTGIEMETFAFAKTKTTLESLQFEFTDIKGWV